MKAIVSTKYEAIQWTGHNIDDMGEFIEEKCKNYIIFNIEEGYNQVLSIRLCDKNTLSERMFYLRVNDWLVFKSSPKYLTAISQEVFSRNYKIDQVEEKHPTELNLDDASNLYHEDLDITKIEKFTNSGCTFRKIPPEDILKRILLGEEVGCYNIWKHASNADGYVKVGCTKTVVSSSSIVRNLQSSFEKVGDKTK